MRILVTRLSAMGDVALLLPVLKAFVAQYPQHELMVLSRGFLKPLFAPLPVKFFTADVYGEHKGVPGLYKLHKQIKTTFKPDVILDMHSVMRTRLLGNFFKLSGIPLHRIDKGRAEKKALTRKKNKVLQPLKHTTLRYADVFERAGFPLNFDVNNPPLLSFKNETADSFLKEAVENPKRVIGVAPFAAHKGKMWPAAKMKALIEKLAKQDFEILLFGGPADADELSVWAYEMPNTLSVAARFDLYTEVAIIQKLPLFIGMDSGNMHFAAMVGTPVFSIWGATHPFAGFAPLGQPTENQIQIPNEKLSCRPCSVYGNKPCWRGDYACMEWIEVDEVKENILNFIKISD